MLNQSGIKKTTGVSTKQILGNVELQYSVGIVVAQTVGVQEGTRKIAKAGMPVTGNLDQRTTAFTEANADGTDVVGVLLHDVDVTDGAANATLLLFGFVNMNMIDSTTQGKLVAAVTKALPMIKFIKY